MSDLDPDDFKQDLLKNLKDDLEKFESKKLVEDFVPYKESIIWSYSDAYYNSKGIMAWSNNAPKIIPHKIGTNYQNALAFASLIKANLEQFPSHEKLNIVEAGAGSGRFSRHLLLAFEELEIIDKLKLIISDYSQFNLQSIANSKILDDFDEGKNYCFKVLDITRKTDFDELNPRAFFMHYVLDALPLTILINRAGFEELNLSSLIRKEQVLDVLENNFLQSRLEHEDKWLAYEPKTEIEKKYWKFFSDYHKKSFDTELYYSYTSLEAISNIIEALDKNGFLLNIDIPPGAEKRYIVVGNSIAHEVDNRLLKTFVETKGAFALAKDDRSIARLLVTKNKKSFKIMSNIFNQVFVKNNKVREYIDLEKAVKENIDSGFTDGLEINLKRLTKLAPYYAFTYMLWADYYKLIGDRMKAEEYLGKAAAIDFWDDL